MSYLFAYWAIPGAIIILPSQPVLLTPGADNALRILVHFVVLAFSKRILVLRFAVAATDINGIEFIAADPPMQELLAPCFSVELPLVTDFNYRDREWPILGANDKECSFSGLWVNRNPFLFVCFGSKVDGSLPILWVLSSENNVVTLWTKNFFQRVNCKARRCFDQCVSSLLWSVEGPAPDAGGDRTCFRSG